MAEGTLIWGWSGSAWQKVLVDASGHLQIDVLSSALPSGASTAANQTTISSRIGALTSPASGSVNKQLELIRGYIDGIEGLLNGGLPSALDTDSLKIREQGTPSVRSYGYDGSNWQTLLVESSTYKNLRVKLYDADVGISSSLVSADMSTQRGLAVAAAIYAWVGANDVRTIGGVLGSADAVIGGYRGLVTVNYLFGWNGATWDRLRSYGTGILKVGRAEVGLLTARLTATGQVGATGARKLYWVVVNPSAANSNIELTDDTAGGGTLVMDMFFASKQSHLYNFDPPMEFSNGIYLETFTNITSAIFGYL